MNVTDMKKNQEKADERNEQTMRRIKAGLLLREERNKLGISLADLGEELDVSSYYLSCIERGRKTMSDQFIRNIAKFYQIDENSLFNLLDRTPLLVKEEIEENKHLQRLILEIRKNSKLDNEQKYELYNKMYQLCTEFE